MTTSTLATLNGLMKATQTEVALPEALKVLLSRETVTIKRISGSIFRALFPFVPRAVSDGPPEGFRERELTWLETAPASERVPYRLDLERVKFRALAQALVDPRMTEDEVERLGDDVEPLYLRLLEFSGLLVIRDASQESAPSEAPAA
jgi:hypothetical protein